MRAIKMWVAVHPEDSGSYEVSFSEPNGSYTHVDPSFHSNESAMVEWEEYTCFPVGLLGESDG